MNMLTFTHLIYFRVTKKYGDDKKPKHGPQYKFSTKDELQLVAFTNYCWERNVPKTEEMLRPEIVHYMYTEGIQNRFKHKTPGNYEELSTCRSMANKQFPQFFEGSL